MARAVKNPKIDTRTARLDLPVRREPYWTVISPGAAIGYRRGPGTWIARLRDDAGKQHYESLGAADDYQDADDFTVFNFQQAQSRARDFFKGKVRELAGDYMPVSGPYAISQAIDDYFSERESKGSKGVARDRTVALLHILPALGDIELSKLTTKRLRDWLAALAKSPKLTRAGRFDSERNGHPVDISDDDAVRARRASANRTFTILRAALNFAYHEGRIASDEAWRKVKPFREADAAVVRYLSDDEARRLINTCESAFRDLVKGALFTGCRYGELGRLRVHDFSADARTISVRKSKTSKPRHVALTDEGAALFTRMTAGKSSRDLIFLRDDGRAWGPSHQQRLLEVASARAKIEPAATFNALRHTYASRLAMKGVPMAVIGAQLGHAPGSPITAKHYAHLAPNYVADTVRAALPALGIVEKIKITPLMLSSGSRAKSLD